MPKRRMLAPSRDALRTNQHVGGGGGRRKSKTQQALAVKPTRTHPDEAIWVLLRQITIRGKSDRQGRRAMLQVPCYCRGVVQRETELRRARSGVSRWLGEQVLQVLPLWPEIPPYPEYFPPHLESLPLPSRCKKHGSVLCCSARQRRSMPEMERSYFRFARSSRFLQLCVVRKCTESLSPIRRALLSGEKENTT